MTKLSEDRVAALFEKIANLVQKPGTSQSSAASDRLLTFEQYIALRGAEA
jgi:hypothetical protein